MPDNVGLYLELIRRLDAMEIRLNDQATRRKLFEILNLARVSVTITENAWDIPNVDHISAEVTGTVTINGIANGVAGRLLYISVTQGSLVLAHENGSASATNRINTWSGADVSLASGTSAILVYHYQVLVSDYRWRLLVNS